MSEFHDSMEQGFYHVVPVNDLREHEVSQNCWCRPYPDRGNPYVIVHHSMDGREFFEHDSGVSVH